MRSWCALMLSASLALPAGAGPEAGPANGPRFGFARPEYGRELLTRRDDFVQRLSPFDRAARLKTGQAVSEAEYLAFVAGSVLEWPAAEKDLLLGALARIQAPLAALQLPWPERIALIRTNGREEGSAPYTRAEAIVLPGRVFAQPQELEHLLLHELFHILTRRNPALKARLYGAIGFVPCAEPVLPPPLAALKITNPDAPANDFCIRLQHGPAQIQAVPILYATGPYDPARGGEFFDYLRLGFVPVAGPQQEAPHFELLAPEALDGFYQQVGRNTGYILHPEEILADNFALLLQGETSVPSPEVLARIQAVLTGH